MGRIQHVVVIGSGLSGLRAASVLLPHPNIQVTLLEARKRIGGRTHTSSAHSWKTPLDLGCSWIHGTQGNPLTPIAQASDAIYHELTTCALYDQGIWLDAKDCSLVFDFVLDLGKQAIEYSKHHGKNIPVDASFYSFCSEKIAASTSLSAIEKARALQLSHLYTNITAEEVTKQSLRNYLLEEELPGDSPILASTYAPLMDRIAGPAIDAGIIQLSQQVTRIRQNHDRSTCIDVLNRETGIYRTVRADAVICTVPLGVLKARSIEFLPKLPSPISKAIDALGMGIAEKLYIKMASAFWRSDSSASERKMSSYPRGSDIFAFLPQKPGDSFVEFISLENFPTNAGPVLLCYSAAEMASSIARRWKEGGQDAVYELIMPYIRRLPGYSDAPECQIEDMFSTNWSEDEFSLGSYSFSPTGSEDTARDCNILASGWPSANLFFAGEHTAAKDAGYEIGTAHGAYFSGENAANTLLRHLFVSADHNQLSQA